MSKWPKVYSYPSQSSPGSFHFVRVFEDGVAVCSCRGFTHHNKCWHIDDAKNKPIGRKDPRISTLDKIAIKEQIAEGGDGFELLAQLFPSITPAEAAELAEEICSEEFE